ncbi:cupin, partial [Microbacterium imperiale]|nr:cupin [Microbacterium imperiale]
LTEFHGAAARIASARASGWSDIVRARPLHSAERALEAARAVAAGESAHLADAAVHVAEPGAGPRAFGMCGRLRTYDVAD